MRRAWVLLLSLSSGIALAQEPSATDLDRVVVTATRTEQTLEQVPAAVAVQDMAELRDRGFVSGTDEFRGVTGVFFRRGEGDADEFPYVSIRGSTGTEGFLVLVDGIPQVGMFEEAQLNELPYDAIDRIEIIKGPVSALYGRGALYGAVVLTERAGSPGLTVDDVVGFGRVPFTGWSGVLQAEDRRIVARSLQLSGADAFSGRLFDDLSDGERQRVMIARAIAQQPRLMVLDEITAFLDLPGRVEVMTLLRRHARESGCIVLLSSHDLDLSLQLADQVWLLDGQGGLQVGTPDELVTQGVIGRAFDTPEVVFSVERGRFELVDAAPKAAGVA